MFSRQDNRVDNWQDSMINIVIMYFSRDLFLFDLVYGWYDVFMCNT